VGVPSGQTILILPPLFALYLLLLTEESVGNNVKIKEPTVFGIVPHRSQSGFMVGCFFELVNTYRDYALKPGTVLRYLIAEQE
jgi:hypothetical protein